MWTPKCCDAVECWPDCKSYHFKIRMLNILKGGIYLYGPVTNFIAKPWFKNQPEENCVTLALIEDQGSIS